MSDDWTPSIRDKLSSSPHVVLSANVRNMSAVELGGISTLQRPIDIPVHILQTQSLFNLLFNHLCINKQSYSKRQRLILKNTLTINLLLLLLTYN